MYQTEEARLMRDAVRAFADKHIRPHAEHWHRTKKIPADIFVKFAEAGITTIGIPEEFGGIEGSTLLKTVVGRELGRADAATMLETAGHALFRGHFLKAANAEQMQRVCPDLVAGARGAWGLTGPDSGSDPFSSGTKAEKTDGGWIVNGSKTFITGGLSAKWLVVNAITAPRKMTAFLIKAGTNGFSVEQPYDKVSMPGTETVTLNFDKVFVPEADVLGKVNEAMRDVKATLCEGRLYITSGALGILDDVIRCLKPWMETRKSGGKALKEHGELGAMRADMVTWRFAAESMIAQASQMDPYDIHSLAAATATKLFTSDAALKAASNAAIIFGGAGVVRESPVSRAWVDAMVYVVGEGANPTLRSWLNYYASEILEC